MRADYTGEGWFAVCLTIFALVFLSGCMEPKTPPPTPYTSADDAAAAFAEEIYSTSYYVGFEYNSVIYSITEDGITTYGYTTPVAHDPHESYADNLPPDGTAYVAYIHTHPNGNGFSEQDDTYSTKNGRNMYVIGPNHELLYHAVGADYRNPVPIRTINPRALTATEMAALQSEFRQRWDSHTSNCKACAQMEWPRVG